MLPFSFILHFWRASSSGTSLACPVGGVTIINPTSWTHRDWHAQEGTRANFKRAINPILSRAKWPGLQQCLRENVRGANKRGDYSIPALAATRHPYNRMPGSDIRNGLYVTVSLR
jgi:hypothetical protein